MRDNNQTIEMVSTASSKSSPTSTSIVQWQKCIGGSGNDYGYQIAKAADGSGYFISGATQTTTNGQNVLVAKVDGAGNLLWQKDFGGSGTDEGTSIVATPDGGCLVAG